MDHSELRRPLNNFLVLTATEMPRPRRPSTFLSLAPDTSASWPQMPVAKDRTSSVSSADEPAEPRRRISSVSSGSRVLKLSPVHWGEHMDEHKEDFHDIVSPSS